MFATGFCLKRNEGSRSCVYANILSLIKAGGGNIFLRIVFSV